MLERVPKYRTQRLLVHAMFIADAKKNRALSFNGQVNKNGNPQKGQKRHMELKSKEKDEAIYPPFGVTGLRLERHTGAKS